MTSPYPAIRIPDIGMGASVALWGFRAAAFNHTQCPALRAGFQEAMGPYGNIGVERLSILTQAIMRSGKRNIDLSPMPSFDVTSDELSIVAILAAAQNDDGDLCSSHMSWLLCGGPQSEVNRAAHDVAEAFTLANLDLLKPGIELILKGPSSNATVFPQTGNA
ncbi:MAG: hypothetical protein AAGG02_21825 [Cyanobacteria bacterium P01_H01_bin.15]